VFKEVAADRLHSVVSNRLRDDAGLIEENPVAGRIGVKNIHELPADSAADVGDDPEAAPVVVIALLA
jgi:hypothetical protein